MPEVLISASGIQYGMLVNPDGSINVSGLDISIGSLALSLENVYVTSGNFYMVSGNAWSGIGSIYVTNSYLGSEAFIPAGSIIVTNTASVQTVAITDTGNSTTTPLGANGSFYGTGFDMTNFASWSTTILADRSSASSGLKIQWSDDNSNWDFSDQQTYSSGAGNMITFGRKAKYVRLAYTNGPNAQGVFRVTSVGQPISVRQTRKFVGNALVDQDTGQVVIAAMQGHTTAGGGAWVDIKVSPAGALTVDTTGSVVVTNVIPVTGSIVTKEVNPKDASKNNPQYNLLYAYSGTSTGLTGSAIGSVVMFIGAGSYVRVLGYNGGFLTSVGSWV